MQSSLDSLPWAERPKPSDFGLDEQEIGPLKEEERERQRMNNTIENREVTIFGRVVSVCALLGLCYGFWEGVFGWGPGLASSFGAAVAGFFLGCLIGGVRSVYCEWVVKEGENERHKLLTKYEAALELYVIAEAKRKEKYWKSLRGKDLETELAMLLRSMGVPALLTSSSGDEGIDIDIREDGERAIIQCKGFAKPVGSPAVMHLVGALKHSGADRAILAAPSGFTSPAKEVAKKNGIELWSAFNILTLKWKPDENDAEHTHKDTPETGAGKQVSSSWRKKQGWMSPPLAVVAESVDKIGSGDATYLDLVKIQLAMDMILQVGMEGTDSANLVKSVLRMGVSALKQLGEEGDKEVRMVERWLGLEKRHWREEHYHRFAVGYIDWLTVALLMGMLSEPYEHIAYMLPGDCPRSELPLTDDIQSVYKAISGID